MKSCNKKLLLIISRLICLVLVGTVLVSSLSGCGKKADDSGKGGSAAKTPESVVKTFSEAYAMCDFKTADDQLLYIYEDVMAAATGLYSSAEEYRKVTFACDSNEDYYKVMHDTGIVLFNDIYGEGYTAKATVNSCEKLDADKTQNIKDYYTKFYEACGIDSGDFFNIDDIEEIYVASCTCKISGELEEASNDEVYFVYKTGDEYKVIQCNGVTEGNVMSLIENIPARTAQLEGLVGQGAFKDQPTFNEYFYILGLQKQ